MLQAVERRRAVSRRRALRRAVSLECEILSDFWEAPVSHLTTDLSPLGLWAQTQFPLEPGEEVIVTLMPPSWPSKSPLVALASVARVGMFRRRADARAAGMGLEFIDLEKPELQALTHSLRGIPPPLPGQLRRPADAHPTSHTGATWLARQLARNDPALLAVPGGPPMRLRAEAPLLTGAARPELLVSASHLSGRVAARATVPGPERPRQHLRAVA